MILDYSYNGYGKKLDISYIEDTGMKQIISFNCSRFKSYYSTPSGKYNNWQGDKCDIKWVEKPSKFDIKTFIEELDDKYKKLFTKRTFPKVYTFDIETRTGPNGEFPEPDEANYEITNISICSPNLNTIVLGTLELSDEENKVLQANYDAYIASSEFFKTLGLEKPSVKYVRFPNEEEMLKHFLTNIVSKVPILTGWNSIQFDWQYISNRIRNFYPHLTIKSSSCTFRCAPKQYTNKKGEKITLQMPEHSLILDMMEVIETEDKKVLPMKESMRLDYIAYESIKMHKIDYDGSLDDLYKNDYGKYVFYNSVDSVLVQLINYRFKVLDHIYLYALYCNEKISSCFSKIALTEALVFKDFTEHGLKIVYEEKDGIQRERLIGAYVKKPYPGIHEFVACNDFASLYPSSIRSCNLSFENYVGAFWDMDKLSPYISQHDKYIVVGPNVYKKDGTDAHPKIGDFIAKFLDENALAKYRKDKKYFVSVNGCVYLNDKDYAFKRIQSKLKKTRDNDKYMSKELDAMVMSDIDNKATGSNKYPEHIIKHLESMGYKITCPDDFNNVDMVKFRMELSEEITYLSCNEQAMKLMMNSMYGGASHVSFYWYNMNLANDITGESRNLTQMMEHHIPDFMRKNWASLTDVHKELGITLNKQRCEEVLKQELPACILNDPAAYHQSSYITPIYSDTDSLYSSYENLLYSIEGYESMTIEQKRDLIVKFNTGFLDAHNREYIKEYYDTRNGQSVHNFELETVSRAGVWLDVKKHYSQLLMWKDGKKFDASHLKMKTTGLEMNKASHPRMAREILNYIIRYMLEHAGESNLILKLNIELQKWRVKWNNADVDDISANIGVNGYTKYIVNDRGNALVIAPKCPVGVKALGNYNQIKNWNRLPGEDLYSGKMKLYEYRKGNEWDYFAYQAMGLPSWANKYAPVDRTQMFNKYVIIPLNRIIEPTGMPALTADGNIQMSLF